MQTKVNFSTTYGVKVIIQDMTLKCLLSNIQVIVGRNRALGSSYANVRIYVVCHIGWSETYACAPLRWTHDDHGPRDPP